MNNPTPMFKPLGTAKVWLPKYVASLITSLNQNDIDKITISKAICKKRCAELNPCIVKTPEVVIDRSEILVKIGHGEGDTR